MGSLWINIGVIFCTMILLIAMIFLELAYTTEKNRASVAIQKLLVFSISGVAFVFGGSWLVSSQGNPFVTSNHTSVLIVQTCFVTISSVIACTAIAERARLRVYVAISLCMGLIAYPVLLNTLSSTGWLTKLGFQVQGGGVFLHLLPGVGALVSSLIVGPRLGKYKNNRAQALPSGMLHFGIIGTAFAWLGWSVLSVLFYQSHSNSSGIAALLLQLLVIPSVTTVLTFLLTKWCYKRPDISITLNGTLIGVVVVSVTGSSVTLLGALLMGLVATGCMVAILYALDHRWQIDDPLGVSVVHGIGAIIAFLFIGLFDTNKGLFYGGGLDLLLDQLLGTFLLVLVLVLCFILVLKIVDSVWGLRLSATEEMVGSDGSAYSIASNYSGIPAVNYGKLPRKQQIRAEMKDNDSTPSERKVPMKQEGPASSLYSIRKFEILTNPDKLERLTQELNDIGVTGLNVTMVTGFGIQKGNPTYYRGVEVETNFLPKIKLETIVSTISTEKMLQAIRKALYTGHIGDGKVFVSEVSSVFRVSTGQQDEQALEYEESVKKEEAAYDE